jgi:hypothetical protein
VRFIGSPIWFFIAGRYLTVSVEETLSHGLTSDVEF